MTIKKRGRTGVYKWRIKMSHSNINGMCLIFFKKVFLILINEIDSVHFDIC